VHLRDVRTYVPDSSTCIFMKVFLARPLLPISEEKFFIACVLTLIKLMEKSSYDQVEGAGVRWTWSLEQL